MKARWTCRELTTRLLRVTGYTFVLTVGLGVLTARHAHAQATESAAVVGEQLLRLAESDDADGRQHDLAINGQIVHVTSAHTTLPLAAVLQRFEKACEEHADGMLNDLADLDASLLRAPSTEGHPGIGMLRDDRDGRGVVACFAAGEDVDTARLGARLQRFTRSYDLADLGGLRYVAARTLESGSTEVVATWTEGAFRLGEMFPAEGDASGDDPTAAPRPASARRMLSARDRRAPYGVFLYEVHGEAGKNLDAYATLARRSGWTAHEAVHDRDQDSAAFERDGIDVLVTATELEGGLAMLSIVEMPTRQAPTRARARARAPQGSPR